MSQLQKETVDAATQQMRREILTDSAFVLQLAKMAGLPTAADMQAERDARAQEEQAQNTVLASKADLVNGKVPAAQLPTTTFPVTKVNGKTGDVVLTPADVGAASTAHTHAIGDVTGLQNALTAKADLQNGLVPASQLPSFVDDVLEFASLGAFPGTGESGKIYIAIDSGKTYRWGGSAYTVISDTIALGETSSTAYRGDRGKIAYDHSQTTGANPHGTDDSNLNAQNPANGNVVTTLRTVLAALWTAISGKANTVHTHSIADVTNLQSSLDAKQNKSDVITDVQHGARGGGDLHALATQTTAGFQSGADKKKIDALAISGITDGTLPIPIIAAGAAQDLTVPFGVALPTGAASYTAVPAIIAGTLNLGSVSATVKSVSNTQAVITMRNNGLLAISLGGTLTVLAYSKT